MRTSWFTLSVFWLAACGASQSKDPEPFVQSAPPPVEPANVIAPPPPEANVAPEPTPEEKKQAEEAERLRRDWEQMEASAAAETARFTPDLRAETKVLAETAYPSTRAGVLAILKGAHRKPGNAERDADRHPVETLEFLGVKPTMTVLEYGPGEGWYTEILAPLLAKKGKLIVTMTDPNGPREARPTLYGKRTELFLAKAPELYGKVVPQLIDPKQPNLGADQSVDLVLVMRGMHGWYNSGTTAAWLAEVHRVLKPNGILGVEQHRAAPGANPDETSKQGYLPEAYVISSVEAAGFKLAQKSEINANPRDTRDHPDGVWSLPPSLRGGDQDREKYVAIGESDRMTLRFVKVAK